MICKGLNCGYEDGRNMAFNIRRLRERKGPDFLPTYSYALMKEIESINKVPSPDLRERYLWSIKTGFWLYRFLHHFDCKTIDRAVKQAEEYIATHPEEEEWDCTPVELRFDYYYETDWKRNQLYPTEKSVPGLSRGFIDPIDDVCEAAYESLCQALYDLIMASRNHSMEHEESPICQGVIKLQFDTHEDLRMSWKKDRARSYLGDELIRPRGDKNRNAAWLQEEITRRDKFDKYGKLK